MSTAGVVLVNPRICRPQNCRLPLSLLALGAVLEGRHDYCIVDGNLDPDAPASTVRALDAMGRSGASPLVVGITVMPGPQVASAIEVSRAVRASRPEVPILWGGYFPTLYPDAAVNAPYVDCAVRGQGEGTLLDLLERIRDSGVGSLSGLWGVTWKNGSAIVHNPDRPLQPPDSLPPLPYGRLGDLRAYLRPSFMGARTAVHQAAVGCRYHCTFCGVASMFNGQTRLQSPGRLLSALETLRDHHGATAVQFYDNNFFDREETSVPILEALERAGLPWWCYARADTLAGFSPSTWQLIRRSRLRMAYIGAEAASDSVLRAMRKGTRVEHTLEVAARCREHGVIPEFSFILGGPEDPEEETERTLQFVRRVKRAHPECEVILYFYSPTPQRGAARAGEAAQEPPVMHRYGPAGPELPATPDEWAEPQWVAWVCHQDAPWLSPRMRQRVRDFARVLACRFPTVQDVRTPRWGRAVLRAAASWRYATGRFDNPWELERLRRLIPLKEPQTESL